MGNCRGVVHGRPESGVAAAIMSCDGKPVKAEAIHQRDAVPCFRTLRGADVVGCVLRYGRLAEASQVRTDHRLVSGENRRDLMPGDVCAGCHAVVAAAARSAEPHP